MTQPIPNAPTGVLPYKPPASTVCSEGSQTDQRFMVGGLPLSASLRQVRSTRPGERRVPERGSVGGDQREVMSAGRRRGVSHYLAS
jgi:hypothetical protein